MEEGRKRLGEGVKETERGELKRIDGVIVEFIFLSKKLGVYDKCRWGGAGELFFLRDSLELIENKCRNSKNENIVEDQ